ncbi:MAG: LemA family protein [Actinobacteria bacterium]|nr:MAG: LemA family protein [Actinomycetota bacterium]
MTALWVIIGIVVLLLLIFGGTYNRLVALRNRIDNSWSQIGVQLKRRYDLIPNLVNTVKGYAAHEKEIFEKVAEARNSAISAKSVPDQAQAENQITQALRQLFAVVENYPDLKANQNFLALQEELTATEGRIAFARQFYNDTVLSYNNKVQQFPSRIVAGMFNFTPREFFQVEEAATGPVNVQF